MSDDARMDRIEDHFDDESGVYDEFITQIIPGYDEQNRVLLESLDLPSDAGYVADLGIGTGQLSDLVLERFPEVHITGFDFSQGMLDQAEGNLGRYGARVSLVSADLADDELFEDGPVEGFDAVVAGLSIHHLDDEAKRALFARVYEALVPGGFFLIRDVVLGDTPEETERMEQGWREFIRSNGRDDEEVLAAHHAEDMPSPLSAQLTWLADAGFVEIEVVWQEMVFAIFGGQKPSE